MLSRCLVTKVKSYRDLGKGSSRLLMRGRCGVGERTGCHHRKF